MYKELNRDKIKDYIVNCAVNINEYVKKHNNDIIIALPILTGAMQFTVDLLKRFNTVDFENTISHIVFPVIIKSYSTNMSKKEPVIKYFEDLEFIRTFRKYKNPLVLIIDDIADTGDTIEFLKRYVNKLIDNYEHVKHVKTAVFLYKPHTCKTKPDFYAYKSDKDVWWIGYGMDDNDKNRFTYGLYYIHPE